MGQLTRCEYRTAKPRRFAVQPHRLFGSAERIGGVCQAAADDPGQHVPRAGCGEPAWRSWEEAQPFAIGQHIVRPLSEHHRTGRLRQRFCPSDLDRKSVV